MDNDLYIWRLAAHAAFDKIWNGRNKISRHRAYTKLAYILKIPVGDCHIRMFDIEMCKRVIEICESWGKL